MDQLAGGTLLGLAGRPVRGGLPHGQRHPAHQAGQCGDGDPLPVLGQALMGLLVDSLGLFRAQQIPLTPLRAGGAVLVLAGGHGGGLVGAGAACPGPAPRRQTVAVAHRGGGRGDVQRHPDGHQRPPGPGGGLPPDGLHGVLPGGAGGAGGAVPPFSGSSRGRPPWGRGSSPGGPGPAACWGRSMFWPTSTSPASWAPA